MDLIGALASIDKVTEAGGWDLANLSFVQSLSVSAQESNPSGVQFKPDGTKMYIIGAAGDEVNEYDLSTAWDISSASYVQNFYVGTKDTQPSGLFFKTDGTKMYFIGPLSDSVHEYDLSSAWDISSATFLQSFSVSAKDSSPFGLFFRDDGLKMYITGNGSDSVHEYDLSSAWNVSTASFLQSFSVAAQASIPQDVAFKPDGTIMYVVDDSGNDVNQYSLSTAWDISTASYVQASGSVGDTIPTGVAFKPDGKKMYICGSSSDRVREFDL